MLRSRFASWISAWAVGLILIVSVAPGAVAQDPAVKEAPQPKAAKPADAESKSKAESKPRWGEASADASGKPTRPPRAIGVDDAENWPVLRSARLSNDGVWFGFIEGPGSGDSTFVLRRADGTGEPVRIDVGTRGSFTFSENSQWVGVIVGPTEAEAERARKSKKPAERKLELFRADAPGQRRTFDNIASFAFSGESSAWVAVRKASAGGGAGRGGDLVLHELATERQLGIGNVGSFAFEAARKISRIHAPQSECPSLTERQAECVALVARGKTDWEISQILGIGQETVIQHVKDARDRYGVTKRTLLAIRALFEGQISFADVFGR